MHQINLNAEGTAARHQNYRCHLNGASLSSFSLLNTVHCPHVQDPLDPSYSSGSHSYNLNFMQFSVVLQFITMLSSYPNCRTQVKILLSEVFFFFFFKCPNQVQKLLPLLILNAFHLSSVTLSHLVLFG